MENKQVHWESIYKLNDFKKVSWYQENPTRSKTLIQNLNLSKSSPIIDIGGGASYLANSLINIGYRDVTVNDISLNAINISKRHNIQNIKTIKWIAGNITNVKLPEKNYKVWHDRAVFHFLTRADEREKYKKQILNSVSQKGHVIISTFSLKGPKKCSGLPIKQYSEKSLLSELGKNFKLINHQYNNHSTPSGNYQNFLYCCFQIKE